ncbi:MAG: hypothetical protein UW78_C0014G0012 [Candidatus Azambacteria bacterium GW2011_GWA1_44_9]|uniref:Uncharacterized protein n=2 Tax=Parcubacteria group TaxID=1794811 RepID=A0A0G1MK75_9BACT|nr:MAG: hypothetical protein UW78_C0014G0012 [Candidatus Azambacteria bacterium GW2011_GWA1_44_9]
MDKRSEIIQGSNSAREIMREARRRFKETLKLNPVAAYVALANTHCLLIRRYMSWWQWLSALSHMACAMGHAKNASLIAAQTSIGLTADETDVVARIFAKSPWWLGGDRAVALSFLYMALYLGKDPGMKPHTRALMLMTLAEIEVDFGDEDNGWKHYQEAVGLCPEIESECHGFGINL